MGAPAEKPIIDMRRSFVIRAHLRGAIALWPQGIASSALEILRIPGGHS